MTALTVFLCVLCQVFLVGGQLFLKHGMRDTGARRPMERIVRDVAIGIVLQALWFFFWINLLKDNRLSRIFPFEGLNPVFLVFAAWLFLRERLTVETWAGVLLICAGLFLVTSA